ncbi:hypothetical protein HJB53_29905 [Rhizobium lentis]|uniref:hypothetical protein n=1 Tax=Rhizobium lentis TaxID=1138194 RepID=UPI001C830842|nr:hypothetical protein [Rhizobium lentis]MBX5130705.1 hypothetical protein [Rhizobium lentis]
MARKPKVPTTIVRRGRRIYGHIYHFANRNVYLAARKLDQIFRFGEKCNSDALRKELAAWALDEETLTELRLMKIVWVGVKVKQNNDIYITRIENFFDSKKTKFLNFERRGGAAQRYLPIKYFTHIPGQTKIR